MSDCHTDYFRAVKKRINLEPGADAMLKLPAPFHDKKPHLLAEAGFLLKGKKRLDLGVLRRCDRLESHCSFSSSFFTVFSGFICGKNSTSCMVVCPVMNIVRRSIPIPRPEVGGIPYSSARTKS